MKRMFNLIILTTLFSGSLSIEISCAHYTEREEREKSTGASAFKGAIVGGGLGAIIGAAAGGGKGAAIGGGVGIGVGMAWGAIRRHRKNKRIQAENNRRYANNQRQTEVK